MWSSCAGSRTEVDLYCGARPWVGEFEVLGEDVVMEPGHDARGKALHASVVRAHVAVVEAPSGGDAILCLDELVLQCEEVGTRLEVRVALGNGDQRADRPAQLVLGAG